MMESTQDLVALFAASGQTQKAFCAEHSISVSKLQSLLRKSRQQSSMPGFVSVAAPRSVSCAIVTVSGSFTPEQIVAVVKGLGG